MHVQFPRFAKAVLVFSILATAWMAGPLVQSSWAQDCLRNCDGLSGVPPQSPAPRSYDQFIITAYRAAYNRFATCTERRNEYFRLLNASGSSTALNAEARRFVATLFMTQASYDVQDLITYRQTTTYQAINPQENVDRASIESFVNDLYDSFLQRPSDAAGLCFWSNNVCQEGRKKGIRAFEVSIEFGDLTNGLFDDGEPCPPVCRTCEPL
ncbi:MAG TPA: DUF4214 domain-containing protein [Thermoanaerobaculia bacterium]|jgi:hypothetical protein|nr:DUF4214 domain-containing protein [Thermoanaerobaculia bacterium]